MSREEDLKKSMTKLKKNSRKVFSELLKFRKKIKKNASKWRRGFYSATKAIPLLEGENQAIVDRAFDAFINKVEIAAESIPDNATNIEDIGIHYLASKKYIELLEGILELKKSIKQEFPGGLDDRIIKASGVAITAMITYFCPIAGLIVEASGIMQYTAESLENKNLQKTIDRMKGKVDQLRSEKDLETLYNKAEKVAEIAAQAEIEPEMLIEELSEQEITEIKEEVAKAKEKEPEKRAPASKPKSTHYTPAKKTDALKVLSQCFARLPADKTTINRRKTYINLKVNEKINSLSIDSKLRVKNQLTDCNEDITEISRQMHKPGVSLLERVIFSRKIKERYSKLAKDIVSTASVGEIELLQEVAKDLNINAEHRFGQPVSELKEALNTSPSAKKIAKIFGLNKKIEIQIEKYSYSKGMGSVSIK